VGDLAEVRQGGLPTDFVESGVDLVSRFDVLSDKRLNDSIKLLHRQVESAAGNRRPFPRVHKRFTSAANSNKGYST